MTIAAPRHAILNLDLLAQYFIEKEQFDIAYEQMKEASNSTAILSVTNGYGILLD